MIVTLFLLVAIFFGNDANAHMLMKFPPPRGYKGFPAYADIDYNLNAPLPNSVPVIYKCFSRQCARESLRAQWGQL